ncbi:polysaccharide biosynthesis protein [Zhongshania aliphaticivorans]|uniref:polysaccharide biosynthesis protein n=1 Tax=Zhongshania aliphaticivorans TaxID=1470434 RepID=UPI0039C923F2
MNGVLQSVLGLSRWRKRFISLISDALFLLFSFWVAFALRLEDMYWLPSGEQLLLAMATVVFTLGLFVKLGLYRAIIRFLGDRAFTTIIIGVLASCLALMVFSYLFGIAVPRSVPVIYGALAFLFVSGTRLLVRAVVNTPSQRHKIAVGIIGAGETGMQLSVALSQGTEYRPNFLISFNRDNNQTVINGLPVYCIENIEKAIQVHKVQRLLLALGSHSNVDRVALLKKLEAFSIPVQTVPSMTELVSGQARINDIRDLDVVDLLGRDPVQPDNDLVSSSLSGKSILVSGAGGSIGSELCRQIIKHKPKTLVLFDISEFSLYSIERELASINQIKGYGVAIHALLGSVKHQVRCEVVMRTFNVDTVYHAAAYKHVPLVEYNVIEGVQNNVMGTWNLAEAAIAAGVSRFVLVSTDKAVRPTNVMGASKRLAELVLQGLAQRQSSTIFSMVRFGNVLGSSGSVVPLFRDQIRDGGPITVTHPDIIRYFMTIPEASQLVLQAGSMGIGGEVFVLDMGEPVKIADLARKIIRLMGFNEKSDENPDGDIEIVYSGLRPGEKLYEELLIGDNPQGTAHPRIMMAEELFLPWAEIKKLLLEIDAASHEFDCERIIQILRDAPTGYNSESEMVDLVWANTYMKLVKA